MEAELITAGALEQQLRAEPTDCSDLELVPDHASKPCWVCRNGSIYIEVSSPWSRQAAEFLIAIAEPQSRPHFFHHYTLTAYSLYAGASVNLDTNKILNALHRLSKNVLPVTVVNFIKHFTQSYGKVKLVLRRNRVFIESMDPTVLLYLLNDETIRMARIAPPSTITSELTENGLRQTKRLKESKESRNVHLALGDEDGGEEDNSDQDGDGDFAEQMEESAASFEILPTKIGEVKNRASMLNYPMLEEYQYQKDDINPDLDMKLRANVKTREYQDRALRKMFGNSNARSGVIVLPCGAGKTLTGISAACTIHKNTLVLCSNTTAVYQWEKQFYLFTTLKKEKVITFVSGVEAKFPADGSAVLLLTTYSMMGMSDDARAQTSREIMYSLRAREWGLVILDEVHMAPANRFRKALFEVKAHCKLGLTATLVREDGKIDDLNFLIGPKLYEADWMDLTNSGYLARVQCAEIVCPMAQVFMKSYLKETDAKGKQFMYVMNPNKLACCERLMLFHEDRQDKVLIFSDTVAAVMEYAECLGGETGDDAKYEFRQAPKRPFMYGATTEMEREELLKKFRLPFAAKGSINTLVISSIGDVAIDLPEANVIIQISSHFASRRQEAQRLGRILRPKANQAPGTFNAYFYTLVSGDTKETTYSQKRRQYLMDQGYSFKNIAWQKLFPSEGDFHDVATQEHKLKACTAKKALELEAKEKKAMTDKRLIEAE
ncbi:hypothetical protein BASA81_002007 [Batrachochytrium salamandrivorans]|nr:hypothetical protein BASA81_002007 [Batrachochytrium salamandrivorans]